MGPSVSAHLTRRKLHRLLCPNLNRHTESRSPHSIGWLHGVTRQPSFRGQKARLSCWLRRWRCPRNHRTGESSTIRHIFVAILQRGVRGHFAGEGQLQGLHDLPKVKQPREALNKDSNSGLLSSKLPSPHLMLSHQAEVIITCFTPLHCSQGDDPGPTCCLL